MAFKFMTSVFPAIFKACGAKFLIMVKEHFVYGIETVKQKVGLAKRLDLTQSYVFQAVTTSRPILCLTTVLKGSLSPRILGETNSLIKPRTVAATSLEEA